jgi:SAM-dependent methyltransferase
MPRGDVNIDVIHVDAPNFILATGCSLPFRNDVFDILISENVIEHSPKPFLFLSELARVTKEWIILSFPHRLGDSRDNWSTHHVYPHRHRFNVAWFQNASKRLGLLVFDEKIGYRHWPFLSNTINQYLGFLVRLPAQITLTFRKVQEI